MSTGVNWPKVAVQVGSTIFFCLGLAGVVIEAIHVYREQGAPHYWLLALAVVFVYLGFRGLGGSLAEEIADSAVEKITALVPFTQRVFGTRSTDVPGKPLTPVAPPYTPTGDPNPPPEDLDG